MSDAISAISMSRVPRSRQSSAGRSFRQAHEAWQDSIGLVYDVRLIGGAEERFNYRAEAFHLEDVVLVDYHCTAQSFDRSRARIGRDGLDHYTLQLCLTGRHGPRDGGMDDIAMPGDLFIADLAQRHSTATSDFSCLNLTVPRRYLAPLLKSPDTHSLRRIPAHLPLMALLRDHLLSLQRGMASMRRDEAAAITIPTLHLAAAAINAGVDEDNQAAVRMALSASIRRHIDAHIDDARLTAESVASAFGISTRKLYYLLEPEGGFSHYVQDERLRRCRRELTSIEHRHSSIAEIAERYGFTHRKSFVRAFRRLFEMTPREMRALSIAGRSRVPEGAASPHLWHWIRDLR